MNKPKYPIYIISKGRFKSCLTAKFFIEDGIDFKLVVEPQEADEYMVRYGKERVLILPFSNLGQGSIPARNWVWAHSLSIGAKRHWIFDDNIESIKRLYKGKRIRVNSNIALSALEDFTERYENIGITGLNYQMFVLPKTKKPFYLNVHIYSALLILNSLPYRWRGRYNEDTDLTLQVLSGGYCTVLTNIFLINKMTTMTMKGGNTDSLYQGHGRLTMARSLERKWPGVVSTVRKFKRPQHHIKDNWGYFDTPLIRRKDIDFSKIEDKYKMKLTQVEPIKTESLKRFYLEETNGKD